MKGTLASTSTFTFSKLSLRCFQILYQCMTCLPALERKTSTRTDGCLATSIMISRISSILSPAPVMPHAIRVKVIQVLNNNELEKTSHFWI